MYLYSGCHNLFLTPHSAYSLGVSRLLGQCTHVPHTYQRKTHSIVIRLLVSARLSSLLKSWPDLRSLPDNTCTTFILWTWVWPLMHLWTTCPPPLSTPSLFPIFPRGHISWPSPPHCCPVGISYQCFGNFYAFHFISFALLTISHHVSKPVANIYFIWSYHYCRDRKKNVIRTQNHQGLWGWGMLVLEKE